MATTVSGRPDKHHLAIAGAEPWVERFAALVRAGGDVLDLACGNGRHGRLFLSDVRSVVFLDRDTEGVIDLMADPRAEVMEVDLEAGKPWPLPDRRFAAVVVVNYLYRPLFPWLIQALEDGGVLLYDTFARGNERHGRPRNPDHLLRAGELLDVARGALHVVAFEQGIVEKAGCPGIKQRLCAIRNPRLRDDDGEPEPVPVAPPDGDPRLRR